jgi:hypothetical protein
VMMMLPQLLLRLLRLLRLLPPRSRNAFASSVQRHQ